MYHSLGPTSEVYFSEVDCDELGSLDAMGGGGELHVFGS
jgi:hypothetical protein